MPTEPATVVVTLGSTPYVLRPTYDASRILNRLTGGMLPLFRAVSNVDADTMTLIVAAGVGAKGKAVEDIGRAVWAHGLEDLVEPLTRFLTLCTNGGRDPAAVKPKPAGDVGTSKGAEVVEAGDSHAREEGAPDRALQASAQQLDPVQGADQRDEASTVEAGAPASHESTAA